MEAADATKGLPRKRLASYGKRKFSSSSSSPIKKRRLDSTNHSRRSSALHGTRSDPLNLSSKQATPINSTHPILEHRLGDQPDPLPAQLHHDPLNLEGKIENFDSIVSEFNKRPHPQESKRQSSKASKRRKRQRKKSQSESSSNNDSCLPPPSPTYNPDKGVYRYGNYTQYYGYRNKGREGEDPRLKLLKKEWFSDKVILDIGSNTGLLTLAIAREFSPKSITGVDIDGKLVRIAWKNLHRGSVSMVTPSGQAFPKSLTMRCLPGLRNTSTSTNYTGNVEFKQVNYVPMSDDEVLSVSPSYDVIMCLSLTKWVHLNWGDDGLKRMFRKIYRHLRPGGILILEPQPWSSYSKRKKLTETIFNNYQEIQFFPGQFTSYLMSAEVGFTRHHYLGKADNTSPGFQRCMHIYTKPESHNAQLQATPTEPETTPTEAPTTSTGDQAIQVTAMNQFQDTPTSGQLHVVNNDDD